MAREPPVGPLSSPSTMWVWTVSSSLSKSNSLLLVTDFVFSSLSSFTLGFFYLAGKSCFSPLFKFEEMQEIVKNFTLIHIDAPGQEEGAATYPAG